MNNQAWKSFIMCFSVLSVLLITLSSSAFAQSIDTLHIILDMRTPINQGWLDPESETVGLRGDQPPLYWNITYPAADSDGDGLYTASIPFKQIKDSLIIDYKIKVDGVNNPDDGWQAGRNHKVTVYAGKQNRLTMKWEDQAKAPPPSFTGNVEIIKNFNSAPLVPRNIYIYLPPGYNESDQRYPVLYMHDGQNIFDASATGQEWKVDEAAQSLIKQHQIEPIIIVGIGNTKNRIDEYTPTRQIWKHVFHRISPPDIEGAHRSLTGSFVTEDGDSLHLRSQNGTLSAMIPGSNFWQSLIKKSRNTYYLGRAGITFHFPDISDGPVKQITADKVPMGGEGNIYENFILNKLKPFIDSKLRTKPGPQWTALGGSSLGGLITLYIGLEHPDVFGSLLVVSPSVWWDNRWILKKVKKLSKPTGQKIWLDIGTAEGGYSLANVRALRDALLNINWPDSEIEYREAKGATHSERSWAERAPDMLRFLYAKDKMHKK